MMTRDQKNEIVDKLLEAGEDYMLTFISVAVMRGDPGLLPARRKNLLDRINTLLDALDEEEAELDSTYERSGQ